MQFTQLLSLILSCVSLTQAVPTQTKYLRPRHSTVKQALSAVANADVLSIKNFTLTDITSAVEPKNETWHLSTTFTFADLNSNTSTSCSQTWPQTSGANAGAPLDYILCESVNNSSEFFQWRFTSYSSPRKFAVELAHEFSDPTHYPPPYNYVEYFAVLNVSMTCEDAAGLECYTAGPMPAIIDAISN